jgi:uncharacterized protein YqjF (DUF2071 family)
VSVARPFLVASWRYLAMLNYEVPAALLRPMVPAGTELDCFRGAALVTVVGFRFLGTRVFGVAFPGHRDFDEVNLRFYVRRRAEDGWRRAVVFVRELVPRAAIALVARWTYNEPYTAVPMRHDLDLAGAAEGLPGRASYEWWLAGRWHRLEVRTTGRPTLPDPESEVGFIAERDWGYTVQRDGGTKEYRVTHPPWLVWTDAVGRLDSEAGAMYGEGFAECLAAVPRSAFLAEGSEVQVYGGRRLSSGELRSSGGASS